MKQSPFHEIKKVSLQKAPKYVQMMEIVNQLIKKSIKGGMLLSHIFKQVYPRGILHNYSEIEI